MTWVALAIVIACAAWSATRMRVTTSITQFAIDPEDARLGPWLARLAVTEPARTMVVSIGGAPDAALVAARELAAALESHAEVESIRTGPDPDLGERLYDALYPRRFRLVDRDPEAVRARFSAAALASAAERLRGELGRPTGVGLKRVVPGDPWLLFLDRTRALRAAAGDALTIERGQFVTASGEHAIVLLTTVHGPFDGAHQSALDDAIEAERAVLEARHGVTIERSALHRFAVQSERTIRAELQLLSMLSMGGVALMLLVAFRRLGALVLTMVPLGAGVVVAIAVTLAVSGQIHALTLAFGTTLVGVCVDYPVHLLTHHLLERDDRDALSIVWPALVLGTATTVAGFAALAVFGLPGVREMGLFAATGVVTALGATRWLVAPWLAGRRGVDAALRSAAVLDRGIEWLARRRLAVATIAIVGLAIALAGWTRAHWVDDARALSTTLPTISEEDARVRARIGGGNEIGRVLIAEGKTFDDAAAVQDRVWSELDDDTRTRVRSSAPILWSTSTQDASLAAVQSVPDLAARTRAALVAAGFRPEPFVGLEDAIASDPGPLDHAAILDSGLGDLVRPFTLETEDGVALLSFAGDVDPAILETAATNAGAIWFDQRAFTEGLYRDHRRGSLRAVGLGLVIVLLVLGWRYRSARRVAVALVPALVAAAAALGLVAWTGVELQLLHLVAGLLVLSMGVDYGVFLVETEHVADGRPAAVLGVAIACATTVLAFGVLGTSSNPALAAIGTTTALGVALAAILAPVLLAVAGTTRRR